MTTKVKVIAKQEFELSVISLSSSLATTLPGFTQIFNDSLQKICCASINFCMCTVYMNILEFILNAYLRVRLEIS